MKKILMFFIGVLLIGASCVALMFSGAIYDASNKIQVETKFFQPNNLSDQRPGVPASPSDLGDEKMINLLVAKFINEYFYVVPDVSNIAPNSTRMKTMQQITMPDVFQNWKQGEAQTITKMAQDKKMRTVKLKRLYKPESDALYWVAEYELRTWNEPNNLTEAPIAANGEMFLDFVYEHGIPESIIERGVHKWLGKGYDPITLFKFRVMSIAQ